MKNFFYSLIFILFTFSVQAQVDSIQLVTDSISGSDTIIKYSDFELELKHKEALGFDINYLSDEKIDVFINLKKEELPDLTDEIIKEKLSKIPTTINIRFTPSIGNQIRNYIYFNRSFLVKMLTKAEYYFPLYEVELDKNNLPLELKYVSIIESHLNPLAKSPMGATGLWQFMYATAKYKGMSITSIEDERRNPQIATQFAVKYFEQLHSIYEDWLLAISAYNAGAGNINKAIRASGGYSNYWLARPYMPRETQLYVPKIIAIMYAMHYAEDYYIYPRKPKLHYTDVEKVKIFDKLSFKYTSELLGVEESILKELNPSLTKNIIPQRDTGYVLKIPNYALGYYDINKDFLFDDPYFKEEIVELEEKIISDYSGSGNYTSYTVTTGDNLGFIAEKFGCRVSEIKRWNGLTSNFLNIGKKLKLYGVKKSTVAENNGVKESSSSKNNKVGFKANEIDETACNCKLHEIVNGDNLWDISVKYGSSIESIKKENNIPQNWRLKLGVFLKIPKS